MKQIITTKNGVSYERNGKDKVYDTIIFARFKKEQKERLDEIAKMNGTTTSVLIRNVMEQYIEGIENGE